MVFERHSRRVVTLDGWGSGSCAWMIQKFMGVVASGALSFGVPRGQGVAGPLPVAVLTRLSALLLSLGPEDIVAQQIYEFCVQGAFGIVVPCLEPGDGPYFYHGTGEDGSVE
jgi:hypothetical protein